MFLLVYQLWTERTTSITVLKQIKKANLVENYELTQIQYRYFFIDTFDMSVKCYILYYEMYIVFILQTILIISKNYAKM